MIYSSKTIAVFGAGYVGLTTSACFASLGHTVKCVDVDADRIDQIITGQLPIHEDGLDELVTSGLRHERLAFTTDASLAVRDAEFVFLCLPTPTRSDGSVDIRAIQQVVQEIREKVRPGCVIVNKSTVPVKSSELVIDLLSRPDVFVVSNPEFLREGTAVRDFLSPDRIVVGAHEREIGNLVASLYLDSRAPVVVTDPSSSETIKYLSNAFLAMKVSFVNEAARYCDQVGADVLEVMKGLSLDPRIGDKFLAPGPGWGGSCFPKDTRALASSARREQAPLTLIEQAIASNDEHMAQILDLVSNLIAGDPDVRNVGLLGLAFKAGTNDMRESPAIKLGANIAKLGHKVSAYDPVASGQLPAGITRVASAGEALLDADIAIIATEWEEFRNLSPQVFNSCMRGSTILDLRYILDRASFKENNLIVKTIGRNVVE